MADAADRLLPHSEICQRSDAGAGYAVPAAGKKDQCVDVSGGQLLFRRNRHSAAPENGRAAEKAGSAGGDSHHTRRFTRQPLYNMLRKRKVSVRADVTCLFTKEDLKNCTVAQLDEALDKAFGFDNFAWQQENNIVVDDANRADGLNRILYRCPHCQTEGATHGQGTTLTCRSCGKIYELTELGYLQPIAGDAAFTHIPDWYAWQRQQVRKELEEGTYRLDEEVDIGIMVDYKALYMVGSGKLTHTTDGFTLTGCDGQLHYTQGPLACYSLYADYYWYEIADMICIGNQEVLYYCFPKNKDKDVVAKTRLAAEELYKMKKQRKKETANFGS